MEQNMVQTELLYQGRNPWEILYFFQTRVRETLSDLSGKVCCYKLQKEWLRPDFLQVHQFVLLKFLSWTVQQKDETSIGK